MLNKAQPLVGCVYCGSSFLAQNGQRFRLPRLILLDLMMPEMDGFELLDALKKNPEWNSIPVIVVTAKEITSDQRAAMKGQVSQILEKGAYGFNELLDVVCKTVKSQTGRDVAT